MDKISHLMEQEVVSKKWHTFRMGIRGPMISHLMFANDILLFGEATKNQIQRVMDML